MKDGLDLGSGRREVGSSGQEEQYKHWRVAQKAPWWFGATERSICQEHRILVY